jgi:hypothetical protein
MLALFSRFKGSLWSGLSGAVLPLMPQSPRSKRINTDAEKLSTADTAPLRVDQVNPAANRAHLQDTKPIRRTAVRARMRRLAAGTNAPKSASAATARADTVEDGGPNFDH